MMDKNMVCGSAFEDLDEQEMYDVEGGWTSIFTVTTLPCGIGASISTIGVSITFATSVLGN